MKAPKIILANQFHSDNIGDKLLNRCLCKAFISFGFEVVNIGFAQTTEQSIKYINLDNDSSLLEKLKKRCPEHLKFRLKYKKRLRSELKNIDFQSISAIVIGGGQLIKKESVFLDCLEYWSHIAKINNCMLCLYGVGVDTGIEGAEKQRYKRVLQDVNYINCRDYVSKMIIEKIFEVENVSCTPDIAFFYSDTNHTTSNGIILVMPYNYEKAVRAFGFSDTRDNYYNRIYNYTLSHYIQGDRIILTATTTDDAKECYLLRDFFNSKSIVTEIYESTTVEELYKCISNSRIIITGRMHAMIMAIVSRVNVIPLDVSDKIKEFSREYLLTKERDKKISDDALEGVKNLAEYIEREK